MRTTSITARKAPRLWAVFFWLAVWQGFALLVGEELLLPGPIDAAWSLVLLMGSVSFWQAAGYSAARILGGFFLAAAAGVLCAACGCAFRAVRELLQPLVDVMKAVPVASFILLALMCVPSRKLPLLISFLIVFPTVYGNVLEGSGHAEAQLLEMARVFRVPPARQIRSIYLPQVMPYFRSACSLSLGLCWKAGVAAEIIGLPAGSVGERLYTAKIYFETPELFAWTAAVVALSALSERLILGLMDRFSGGMGGA
ncbi:ABC transporter permease subunit [Oscillibacter sp. MSJ-2]|uniref:ABC transporter permease subunit n=1 Tax=Dysosmobacter acutus TaxID=2841504 RepID=A0ABS6FDP6_9FIRM|nr:ABC transporter permease subunit [Dysosmobacter acutus]MBU5627682.1 ABC transporter permease subunit [Dysosmobacter acutus]